jgi:diaminopimelate epimerase
MKINFTKMNGCGNDFLVIDNRTQSFTLGKDLIVKLADYKKAIGFDQLMVIGNSLRGDVAVQIYNSDGSEAKACGNGSRAVARLVLEELGKDKVFLEVGERILEAQNIDGLISVNMGRAEIINNEVEYEDIKFGIVNIGNLHLVLRNQDEFEKIGPSLSKYYKANVNFTRVGDKENVFLKTWEKGVGPTLACGSGACASFYFLYKNNLINKMAKIKQPGGDVWVSIDGDDLILTGDAEVSYRGSFEL